MEKRGLALLLSLLAVVLIVSACSAKATSTTPVTISSLDGATLVLERCSVCHPLTRIESAKRTSAEWTKIVETVIRRGAKLDTHEQTLVVDYLATNFGN